MSELRSNNRAGTAFLAALFALLFVTVSPAGAQQVQLSSLEERYYRALTLTGRAEARHQQFRSLSLGGWTIRDADHPWADRRIGVRRERAPFELGPQRADAVLNTAYPSGGNDFGVWQGAGLTGAADFAARWTPVDAISLTVAPRVFATENRAFPLVPPAVGDYGYFVGGIDWPQRFGDVATGTVTPGESEIRFRLGPVSLGAGSQSVRFGPAWFQPIILSNNAPGIPHVDVTVEPVRTPIGWFDVTTMWGQLQESAFYDEDPDNDRRFFSALAASYRPRWIPGLTLGVHRTAQSPWSELGWGAVLDPLTTRMSAELGDDNKDQRAALTADWLFPTVGFRSYVEWARNDYSPQIRYIVRAPGHSQAYTLGFEKDIPTAGPDLLVLYGELTQLVHSRDYYIDLGMGRSGFYHHGINRQGYTHRGQIIGAPIGTGADSQTIGVDWYTRWGMLGGRIARTGRNKDYLYGASDAGPGDIKRSNVEMLFEVSGAVFLRRDLMLRAVTSYARNINRNYVVGNDVSNWRLALGVTYRPVSSGGVSSR